jgi:hypothetical protein
MQKLRGALNKVTETNLALLSEEVKALQFQEEELRSAGSLVYSRALAEPKNSLLFALLVKGNSSLKESFLYFVKSPVAGKGGKEGAASVKLLCLVRSEGMINATAFNTELKELSKRTDEEVAECICAALPFKNFISPVTFSALSERVLEVQKSSTSIRTAFLCETFLEPTSPPTSDSDSCASDQPHYIQRTQASCTIYLSNIDCEATEFDLARALCTFGELCKVRLCGNPRQATQYAFVEFVEERSANLALSRDGKCLVGKAALRMSRSKSVIQDACPTDAVMSSQGREKFCTFGFEGMYPSKVKLRNSRFQQCFRA